MAKYRVIKYFTDLQDNSYAYHMGDTFPREGLEVTDDRIKELSTKANRRKQPLIEALEEPVEAPVEAVPEESTEEPKEEPQEVKADESPSKTTKAKKNGKKN